jgi:hypothetical protein
MSKLKKFIFVTLAVYSMKIRKKKQKKT